MTRYYICSQYHSEKHPLVAQTDNPAVKPLTPEESFQSAERYFYTHVANMIPHSTREISEKEAMSGLGKHYFDILAL